MVNDSVREELQTKIGVSRKLPKPPPRPAIVGTEVKAPVPETPIKLSIAETPVNVASEPPAPKVVAKPTQTVELNVQKTSPTLVGFQPKNPTVPDWRLELQNAVRTRKGTNDPVEAVGRSYEKQLVTRGANALKAEYVEAPQPETKPAHKNPKVAAALKRISDSRSAFFSEESPKPPVPVRPAQPNKSFPFNVVQPRDLETTQQPRVPAKASVNVPPKPRLVSAVVVKKNYDTNKLPPIEGPEIISSLDMPVDAPEIRSEQLEFAETSNSIEIITIETPVEEVDTGYIEEPESEDIEDLAPFSMRFNAGLFDLIIGAFGSLVLLSPLSLLGGDWISMSGFITFAATCSIVMFVYMTLALGLYGKTFGMRMFSLELVDADENQYPTFHQAAVHSAAYLLSLPLLGIGFVTVLFNEERRAVHELLSGTISVVEF